MHTGPNRGLSAGQEKVRPEEKTVEEDSKMAVKLACVRDV